MKVLIKHIALKLCEKCEHHLNRNQIMYGGGCCPYCGHTCMSTICDYIKKSFKVFRIEPWWKFWKKQIVLEANKDVKNDM